MNAAAALGFSVGHRISRLNLILPISQIAVAARLICIAIYHSVEQRLGIFQFIAIRFLGLLLRVIRFVNWIVNL